jgi:hypothetical protein
MGEAVEGLEELVGAGPVDAEIQRTGGGGAVISKIYPTLSGIQQVESLEVLLAQAAPLLRNLVAAPPDLVDISQHRDRVTLRDVSLPTAEANFQFRLLREVGFVSYRPALETGGRLLTDIRVLSAGREWLIGQYARTTE